MNCEFGEGILADTLNGFGSYILVTMEEPLELIRDSLTKKPSAVVFNRDMRIEKLKELEKEKKSSDYIVGFGGGTACDTAKYLAWKWDVPLIVAPSIVSVDAWLCRSTAVRVEGKVRYIGDVEPERRIVDFSLVKQAPPELNRAGIADVISISTALGDWVIARDEFEEKFDRRVFDEARSIADELIERADDIREVSEEGIRALVKGLSDEVALCERWGGARPEEGSEHFLAYCLEEITRGHYIHGNLIALNVLVVLKLQRKRAVYDYRELKDFFDRAGVGYAPAKQEIKAEDYRRALQYAREYVKKGNLYKGLWWLDNVFENRGEYSVEGIIEWIYSF